jgi:hypothetical protein
VAWFLGSALMGLLYGTSVMALGVFGVGAQLTAATLFLRVRKSLIAVPGG